MSFFKETDYHGSRTYDSDPSPDDFADHLCLRVSLAFAWTKLKIEKLVRLGLPSPQTSSLIHNGEKHFSVLGSRQPAFRTNRPISEIFDLSELNDRND